MTNLKFYVLLFIAFTCMQCESSDTSNATETNTATAKAAEPIPDFVRNYFDDNEIMIDELFEYETKKGYGTSGVIIAECDEVDGDLGVCNFSDDYYRALPSYMKSKKAEDIKTAVLVKRREKSGRVNINLYFIVLKNKTIYHTKALKSEGGTDDRKQVLAYIEKVIRQ